MKISIFTSNQSRHNYFINLLSTICDDLFIVQENRTIFPGTIQSHYASSNAMEKYFLQVIKAEKKLFGDAYINTKNSNINLLPLQIGDLNNCSLNYLSDFLKSDIYIIFGSSYIRGHLADFLIKQDAINIHMGISPYYRGTDCNFWALYDENPQLVGATIHKLSKGLDSGPIIYHALSQIKDDPFLYSMSTVKSAFYSLLERIKNNSIFTLSPIPQDKSKEIRYSKKEDFTDIVVKDFFEKKISLKKDISISLLKDPFFLKNI